MTYGSMHMERDFCRAMTHERMHMERDFRLAMTHDSMHALEVSICDID